MNIHHGTRRRATLACVALIGVIAFPGSSGHGQTISVNNNLVFGNVYPGIPKEIDKATSGSAAEFLISGTSGSEVTIDFSLPTYMNVGGLNMQMIFLKTGCAIDTRATPDQASPERDDLDPWHTITDTLGTSGITLWLGGRVVPKLQQLPGSYSATVVLTVAYTGG
jgi:hypothetical protein